MSSTPENSAPYLLSPPCSHAGTVVLFGEVLADVFADRQVLGGAPFNVARHLRAFGLHPILISRTGNDTLREDLLEAMARFGMDSRGIQCDPAHPTGQVLVHMEPEGHRFEILPGQAYDFIHAGVARMVAMSVKPALIYFGTLAQRHATSRRALNVLLQTVKSMRMLDLNLRKPWYDAQTVHRSLERADRVKMNQDELALLGSMLHLPGGSPQAQAEALMDRFTLEQILVTCGAEGAWQICRDGRVARITGEGPPIRVVDTVGAGDGFAAVHILGEMCNWPAPLVLSRAHAFAAAICGIRGAVPAEQTFYAPFLEQWQIGENLAA